MAVRILHILGDSKFGGGSIVVLSLVDAARSAGFDVTVLTTDLTFQEILRDMGVNVVPLDCIWREVRLVKDLHGMWRLYRFLRGSNYHIVHTHTSKAGFIGRATAWLAKAPIVIHTVHGFAFHEASKPLSIKVYSILERLATNWCHRIVTVSEYHRNWALRLGIGDTTKTVAIPNGIQEARGKSLRSPVEIRSELGFSSNEKLLLTTGRLAVQKGFEFLLRAVPMLRTMDLPKFKVIFVGDGPLRKQLELQAAELEVENNVLFLGFRHDVGSLLGASDIVVLPSIWEGLSIALLEAMEAGKPIVTTAIGSNLEATKEGEVARLVPPSDPASLAQAIATLLRDPTQAEAMGVAANRRFLDLYTEKRMQKEYLKLYEELLFASGVA